MSQTSSHSSDKVLRLGCNLPLSGKWQHVGHQAMNALKIIEQDLANKNNLVINNETYSLEFVYADNKSDPIEAVKESIRLITQNNVMAIIGPLNSPLAIPAGQIANSFQVPMVSPWSTSPITTADRPYVFSCTALFTSQAPAIARFTTHHFKAKKGAVLFNIMNDYTRGVAQSFKTAFETMHGPGSVVSFENFRNGEMDFRKQLQKVGRSDAQFLFVPQYSFEIPSILQQAKETGLTIPIVGGGTWGAGDLIARCGADCSERFFVGNYAPGSENEGSRLFEERYAATYNELPGEPAALTWDAAMLVLDALHRADIEEKELLQMREALQKAIKETSSFAGAAGPLNYKDSNYPSKCPVIIEITQGLTFRHFDTICL